MSKFVRVSFERSTTKLIQASQFNKAWCLKDINYDFIIHLSYLIRMKEKGFRKAALDYISSCITCINSIHFLVSNQVINERTGQNTY